MLVQEYYQELQKGMLRCGVVEDLEDQMVRFYGGLRREIQDIVDYKEFHTVNQLFQFAMLAEGPIAPVRRLSCELDEMGRCSTEWLGSDSFERVNSSCATWPLS